MPSNELKSVKHGQARVRALPTAKRPESFIHKTQREREREWEYVRESWAQARSPTHNMAAFDSLSVSVFGLSFDPKWNKMERNSLGLRNVLEYTWHLVRSPVVCVPTFKCVYSAGNTYKTLVWGSESGESARATERMIIHIYIYMYIWHIHKYIYMLYIIKK